MLQQHSQIAALPVSTATSALAASIPCTHATSTSIQSRTVCTSRTEDGSFVDVTTSVSTFMVNHGAQINEEIISYTAEAMATLLIAIKERLHPFLDPSTIFKIPLCFKSIVPLVSSYALFRDVNVRLQRDGKVRIGDLGVFMNKMGMVVKQVHIKDTEEGHKEGKKGMQGEGEGSLAVGVLPASLHTLTFGWQCNQPLAAGLLPVSLHSLTFGSHFNQPLAAGVLPASLHSLTFDRYSHFNQPLAAGVFPASLHSLTFGDGSHFNQPFAVGFIPPNLQVLKFVNDHYQRVLTTEILPPQLHHMAVG